MKTSHLMVVAASTVLCGVFSPCEILEEFKRALKPYGKIRLMEHVRSEHWLAADSFFL